MQFGLTGDSGRARALSNIWGSHRVNSVAVPTFP
jgi:hypothetical protein